MTLIPPTDRRPPLPPLNAPREPGVVARYLSRFDDGELLRWAFRGLLIGTIGVLASDLNDLWHREAANGTASVAGEPLPILPPAVETDAPAPPSDPRPFVTSDEDALKRPMTFTLGVGGVLAAQGTIEPGTADRLDAELAARGEYVKTVSFDSPGGALDEAMTMATAIRVRKLDTAVADGAICASSCPLAFAGGVHRKAGAKAALGVHQFYAATPGTAAPAQVMSDAQATTARIVRHLTVMNVDPALWLKALDTPPRSLYYFSPDEMRRLRLVTGATAMSAAQ